MKIIVCLSGILGFLLLINNLLTLYHFGQNDTKIILYYNNMHTNTSTTLVLQIYCLLFD